MANIDVVPKQRHSMAWLWIVLAIIVIAVLVWSFARKNNNAAAQLQPSPVHLASVFVPAQPHSAVA
jgi:hypothetical protein